MIFVYNPRKSITAPYGPINVLEKNETGIVSPLYICFTLKTKNIIMFYKWYFKTNKWHRFIYINGDQGARGDRVSIKDEVFFNMPILIPNDNEANKIASFLSLIDAKIKLLNNKIDILKKYKKGLANYMLRDVKKQENLSLSNCAI